MNVGQIAARRELVRKLRDGEPIGPAERKFLARVVEAMVQREVDRQAGPKGAGRRPEAASVQEFERARRAEIAAAIYCGELPPSLAPADQRREILAARGSRVRSDRAAAALLGVSPRTIKRARTAPEKPLEFFRPGEALTPQARERELAMFNRFLAALPPGAILRFVSRAHLQRPEPSD